MMWPFSSRKKEDKGATTIEKHFTDEGCVEYMNSLVSDFNDKYNNDKILTPEEMRKKDYENKKKRVMESLKNLIDYETNNGRIEYFIKDALLCTNFIYCGPVLDKYLLDGVVTVFGGYLDKEYQVIIDVRYDPDCGVKKFRLQKVEILYSEDITPGLYIRYTYKRNEYYMKRSIEKLKEMGLEYGDIRKVDWECKLP